MNPSDVGSGIVSGGETYVWASYAFSWFLILGYTLSLWLRTPPGEKK